MVSACVLCTSHGTGALCGLDGWGGRERAWDITIYDIVLFISVPGSPPENATYPKHTESLSQAACVLKICAYTEKFMEYHPGFSQGITM